MESISHNVNLRYERHELHSLFDLADDEDVEKGGRYDARGGAIHVWSHHWAHPATRAESEMMGSFYVDWTAKDNVASVSKAVITSIRISRLVYIASNNKILDYGLPHKYSSRTNYQNGFINHI